MPGEAEFRSKEGDIGAWPPACPETPLSENTQGNRAGSCWGVRDLWFFFGNSASPCQHSPSLTLWFRSCMRWDSEMRLPSLLFRSWWWVTRERKIRCRVHSAAGILSIFVQVSIFLVYRSGKSENFYFILWIVAILKAWWSWQRSKLPEVRFARN